MVMLKITSIMGTILCVLCVVFHAGPVWVRRFTYGALQTDKIHNFLALIFLVLIMAELGMGREFDLFSHFDENLESWLCEFNFLEAHPGWKLSSHHYLIGQHPPPTHLRHKPSN